jgi:alpha-glucosidase
LHREFPNEPWLADADRQFMLGGALMEVPCLEQGADTVNGVFPGVGDGTVWYDWYTGEKATEGVGPGENVTIAAPLDHIPVFVRGGSVVPMQEPGMTTAESRRNPWGLVVALDKDGAAEGDLYLDDGESLEPPAVTWVHVSLFPFFLTFCFCTSGLADHRQQFTATSKSISAKPEGNYVDTNTFGNATIMGLARGPVRIWLNSRLLGLENWKYDQDTHVLSLHGLNERFSGGAWTDKWNIHWE